MKYAWALLLLFLVGCIASQQDKTEVDSGLQAIEDAINVIDNPIETPAPTINPDVPEKVFREGELVSFPNLQATDPDGDTIRYKFTTPLSADGTWQTQAGDRGSYMVTITASDGINTVSQDVHIIVKPRNYPPTITLLQSSIKVNEGDPVTIDATTNDQDGDNVTLAISGWMSGLTKETSYQDSGTHDVVLSASDGKDTTTEHVTVDVTNVNRAPVLNVLSAISVYETETAKIDATANDPDDDPLSITYSLPFDERGLWQTAKGDIGEYAVTVTASDGDLTDTKTVHVSVKEKNLPPTLNISSIFAFKEGDMVVIPYQASDPEGADVEVTFSGWMTSDRKQTGYQDAGTHVVSVRASDGSNTFERTITVTVEDINRPPRFAEGSFS